MGIRAEGRSFPVESLFGCGCTFILLYVAPLVSAFFGVVDALILVRPQESRDGSVRLGDDPKFHVVPCSIGAKYSEAIPNREFIFAFVLFAELAPISRLMSLDKLEGVLIRFLKSLQGARRGDNTSQGKLRQPSIHIGHLFFHFDCLQVPRVLE